MVIPIRLGFFDETTGIDLSKDRTEKSVLLRSNTDDGSVSILHGDIIVLEHAKSTLSLRGVPQNAVVSLLRELSAPIKLEIDASDWPSPCPSVHKNNAMRMISARMAVDPDPVSRYDAAQHLGLEILDRLYHDLQDRDSDDITMED